MSSPILVPSHTLTIAQTSAPPMEKTTPTPSERFVLFGNSWLDLQNYITSTLALPINQGDFEGKYGTFAKKTLVTGCLDAMKNVQGLSSDFGNPSEIKKKIAEDGNYLFGSEAPHEIYGHIIWLAIQIQNAADTFSFTMMSLQQFLAFGSPQEKASNLKMILTGPGGLASTAADMVKKCSVLSQKLANFDANFTNSNDQLHEYVGGSSEILKSANDLVGQYKQDLASLREAADNAIAAWRNYTIAAVSVGIGLTVLTGGLLAPVALGVSIGLGVAAQKQKDLYNDLMGDIADKGVELKQKTRLVTDLTGLNAQLGDVVPAMTKFKTMLGEIQGVWTDIGGNLAYIANNYTDEQLGNYTWVAQTMKILDAQRKWQSIAQTSQQFTQNSLVDYQSGNWGQQLAA